MSIKQSFIGAYARQRPGQGGRTHDDAANVQPNTEPHGHSEPSSVPSNETPAATKETQQWLEGENDQVLRIDRPLPHPPQQTPSQAETQTPETAYHSEAHLVTAPMAPPTFDTGFQATTLDVDQLLQMPSIEAPSPEAISDLPATAPAQPPAANPAIPDPTAEILPERLAPHHEPTKDHAATVEAIARQQAIESQAATYQATTPPVSPAPESTNVRSNRWNGAAWEVDAFSIPRHVAETFFDENFFRSIADHLGQSVRAGLRSVLVTSLCSGEGRSTTTLGTAIAAAATGLSVAIVDVDLDAPGQAEQVRLDVESDWVTAVRQGQPLESIAIASIEDGVTLLPLLYSDEGSLPATSLDLDRLIDQLHRCFDLVLFDGPCVNNWATARLASAVDSCLIVRDARTTDKKQISFAAASLKRQGVQGIGVVDNFV
ncbi:hypothetical protein LOC67_03605 [Stieleria sp. JC731]|uniref:division plane positioning ATPase MipZ n=1 Tax=Pirellulaceae TaxID=2691357 RepID=UPI001E34B6C8|nr:division plane positioning ATPase MipZ [Stieleria sp. JC731]MCC9599635.1 hypothetical protein [Stieleria sp. JC731]